MTQIKESWKAKGYVDEPIPAGTDLKAEIRRLCKEKNAVIMAHYYTEGVVQDIADFVGDSLALAQKAAQTDADIIVMCGVHFMGETNKILCPDKLVLIPDLNATCSLAESCPADKFAEFVKAHPDQKVISYVNTSAATKAVTDVVVTSTNARQIVESFPKDQPLIFGPDRNLGGYINSTSESGMNLWNGYCVVHREITSYVVRRRLAEFPEADILIHPESKCSCDPEILENPRCFFYSTSGIINHVGKSDKKQFVIATECGVLHKLKQAYPDREFIPICESAVCHDMKKVTLETLYYALKNEQHVITVPKDIADKAVVSIQRMMDLCK